MTFDQPINTRPPPSRGARFSFPDQPWLMVASPIGVAEPMDDVRGALGARIDAILIHPVSPAVADEDTGGEEE